MRTSIGTQMRRMERISTDFQCKNLVVPKNNSIFAESKPVVRITSSGIGQLLKVSFGHFLCPNIMPNGCIISFVNESFGVNLLVLTNGKCTAVFLYKKVKTSSIMGTKILSGQRVRAMLYEMAKSISDSDEFVSELSQNKQVFNLSVGFISGDVAVRAIRKEVRV